jgi:gamma-glutamyltranspeptidase/glutathione hydrolase
LATEGKKGFYTGRIASEIVRVIKDLGGHMTLEDLEAHTSTLVTPISITYKDITVHECPPNGQGITALMALGILEELQNSGTIKPFEELEHNSVEYLHVIIEALRIAFADTRYYVTDPDVVHVPVKEMLNKVNNLLVCT